MFFPRGGSLLPFIYADARHIDAVIVNTGPPVADATVGSNGVYTRKFASGTVAVYNPKTGLGTITWGPNSKSASSASAASSASSALSASSASSIALDEGRRETSVYAAAGAAAAPAAESGVVEPAATGIANVSNPPHTVPFKAFKTFGHSLRADFMFEENYTCMNQGSYGSVPRQVYDFAERVRREQEMNPDLYFRTNITGKGSAPYYDYLDKARAAVAKTVGAEKEDVVLVDNASFGINAVLRSVPFFLKRKGLLFLDTAYFMVKETMGMMAGDWPGMPRASSSPFHARLHQVNVSHMLRNYNNATEDAIVAAVEAALEAAAPVNHFVVFHQDSARER